MKTNDIISLIAIVISILSMLYIREHDDNIRFLNLFNEIYSKTFSLRTRLNKTTEELWNLPFYYEYDSIADSDDVEECILDYLTELENFFSFARNHQLSKRSLKILVSYAFYQRLTSLYSYILKKREKLNNPLLFQNYIKTVRLIKKMKHIKNHTLDNKNRCYIGIRESDIFYAKNFSKKLFVFLVIHQIKNSFL